MVSTRDGMSVVQSTIMIMCEQVTPAGVMYSSCLASSLDGHATPTDPQLMSHPPTLVRLIKLYYWAGASNAEGKIG